MYQSNYKDTQNNIQTNEKGKTNVKILAKPQFSSLNFILTSIYFHAQYLFNHYFILQNFTF